MKLLLVSNEGEVLDYTEISREEWDNLSPQGALALVQGMSPGSDAK